MWLGKARTPDLLIDRIRMFPDCGYRIVGSVVRTGLPEPLGVPALGHAGDLRQIALDNDVDVVFIADRDDDPTGHPPDSRHGC